MSDEEQLARLTYLADPACLGSIEDDQEVEVKVYREADGSVVLWAPDIGWSERFEPAERDKLRELLDRAATPGQVPPLADDPGTGKTSGCPQPGCTADPATASGGLPPKWCTGDCSHGDGDPGEPTAGQPATAATEAPGSVDGCARLGCGHAQARHDGSRPGSPCEDCDPASGCRGWVQRIYLTP